MQIFYILQIHCLLSQQYTISLTILAGCLATLLVHIPRSCLSTVYLTQKKSALTQNKLPLSSSSAIISFYLKNKKPCIKLSTLQKPKQQELELIIFLLLIKHILCFIINKSERQNQLHTKAQLQKGSKKNPLSPYNQHIILQNAQNHNNTVCCLEMLNNMSYIF